ncbi:MAG: HDOD domain-containing protein [Azonexaceae bacterium]|nr:HDOD domain-containing protein [Azonexaceae bacterium]
MSFLKRLFGAFRRDDAPTPLSGTPAAQTPRTVPAAPAAISRKPVAISWQEMLDASSGIAAYLLRPSSLQVGMAPSGPDWLAALTQDSIARLAQRRKILVPITPLQWRSANFAALVGPNVFFLLQDAPHSGQPNAAWTTLAADIRAAGGRLAADMATLAVLAGADFPDLLLLDLQGREFKAFEQQVRGMRQQWPTLQLAVENVASWTEYRFLMALGVGYCLGPFATCRDETQQSDGFSQNRLTLVEMLNLLRREADTAEVVAVAKRDPAVVIKLLEMANSPLSGLSRQVSSLEDAVLLLGRAPLYRWLSLAMFQIGTRDDQRDHTLMVISLSRAAFLESLAGENNRQQAGELFLVGLFSLIDSLLGLPTASVLGKMHLPGPVAQVLLDKDGPYARHLMLAICMERGRVDQAILLAGAIGLDPAETIFQYSEAMAWATADLL